MNFSFRARYPVSTAVNSNTWRRCDVICPVFSVFFSIFFFFFFVTAGGRGARKRKEDVRVR